MENDPLASKRSSYLERFSNDCRKPKTKQLLRPITTGTNSTMNQSQFLATICNSREAREKSRVHGEIGFGFASHWLKNWRESFEPITKRNFRQSFENCSMITLFDLLFSNLSILCCCSLGRSDLKRCLFFFSSSSLSLSFFNFTSLLADTGSFLPSAAHKRHMIKDYIDIGSTLVIIIISI